MAWRIAILGLAAIVVQVVSSTPYLTPDGCNYLSIARRLASDGSFARLGEAQIFHGPGYPVLIAPLFWAGAEPFLLLSFVNVGLLALFSYAVYRWAKQNAPDAAPYLAFLTVVNVVIVGIFRRPLSETVFCAAIFGLAIGYNRGLKGTLAPGWWPVLAAGQCALVFVRQAGLLVGVGFALALLWQAMRGERRWIRATLMAGLVCGPAALALAAWTIHDHRQAVGVSNAEFLRGDSPHAQIADWPLHPLSRRVAEGLRVRIGEASQVTLPGQFKSYAPAECWLDARTLGFVLFGTILLVGWRRVWRTGDVMGWVWPIYFLFHVYWPFNQSARFTAPFAPVLFLFLWRACDRWPTRRGPLFAVLIAAHFAVSLGYSLAIDGPRNQAIWQHWTEVRGIAEQARHSSAPVFVADDSAELQLPLQFLLDRAVPVLAPSASTPEGIVVRWNDSRRTVPIAQRAIVTHSSPAAPPGSGD